MFKRFFRVGKRKNKANSPSSIVLMVSDDENTRTAIQEALNGDTYQLYTASNIDAAVAILNEIEMPQLLIGDFVNPEVDGKEFLKRVGIRLGKSTLPPVLFLMDSKEDEIAARDVGAQELISKPIDPTSFLQCIDKMIAERRVPVAK